MKKLASLSFKSYSSLDLSFLFEIPYINLLFSSSCPFLKAKLDPWIITEAWLEQKLVGLSLAESYLHNSAAEIYSFMVHPSYRRQGIGQLLMVATEKRLVEEEKRLSIGINYGKEQTCTPFLEKILFNLSWSPAQVTLIRYLFNALNFNPSWFSRPFTLPSSFEIFPWTQASFQDLQHICYLVQQGRVLSYLSPFHEEEAVYLPTSLGLRKEEVLIGWSITHLLNFKTLRYTALFIDQPFIHQGLGINLMVRSIQLQQQIGLPWAIFEVNPQQIEPSWAHFIYKRLSVHAIEKQTIKTAIQTYYF